MREYIIESTTDIVSFDRSFEDIPWEQSRRLSVDQFNWHKQGPKPEMNARFLYDDHRLYLRFQVEDHNISSRVTTLNGPTFRDSSVELFADPNPGTDSHYFNFEANCCGYFKFGWQEDGWQEHEINRDLIPTDLAGRIDVETSIDEETREPRPDDEGWWLTTAIPFEVLQEFTGVEVNPDSGTVWRGNVYRSGVATDAQKSTWNPMPTPKPSYHSPKYFGRFRFD